MKVLFLLGSPDIGGGTYVIYQHALKCLESKHNVTIVTHENVTPERLKWHKDAHKLTFKKYEEIQDEEFDVAIATWWRTVYELPKVKAKSYIYFVQSIESRFFEESEVGVRWLAEASYMLPFKIITEATWIKEYLETKYGLDVILVRNGIRKDIYSLNGDKYDKDDDKVRVLVEGPIDVFFKNVPKTIELVRKSCADEIWLLTSSTLTEYDGVDRIFTKIPIEECAKIYRSCDILVKLSYVEGMFGPPLEMFHCGGTAITYNVSGHDEYMKNEYNSLILNKDDEDGVVSAINELCNNRKKLKKLKLNAIKTANSWVDWDKSSEEFVKVMELLSKNKMDTNIINNKINFLFDTYVMYETKNISSRKKIGNFMRKKMPFSYKIYRKILGIVFKR